MRIYARVMHPFILVLGIFAFMAIALFWKDVAKAGTVKEPAPQKRLARK
jgi:hypothetical protein